DRLYTLYKQWEHDVQQAELAREKMLAYQFGGEILETQEPEWLQQQVQSLIAKFGSKEKLGVLQRKLLSSPHKALLQCQLNGLLLEDKSSLKTLSLYLEQECRLKQLSIQLHNALRPLDISVDRQNLWQVLNEIQQFLTLRTQMTHLNNLLRERNLAEVPAYFDAWEPIWERLTQYSEQKSQLAERETYEELLAGIPNVSGAAPQWEALIQALKEAKADEYTQAIADYHTAKAQAEKDSLNHERFHAFQAQYPKASELLSDTSIDWGKSIFRRELDDLIAACLKEIGETDEKLDQLRLLQKDIEKLTIELIAYQTWMNKQAHISEDQKSALSAWRNDLINIGKGYGKNTARNLDSAIENLKKAREVVPIWIMPQDTAIRFFPEADPGQFDLLIVDEASQCDISMLNLIFRARKSIIVGDENQTSVVTNSSMFPMERTNQILDRYLINHPFKQQFHLNSRTASIYTLSGVIYPNIVSLREHFRCRPEIINYSNRNMYNEQMVPLKTATHDLFGKPVEAHYVEDDPTDRSKPALVRAAVELIEGVVADFKAGHLPYLPSIGLLCMETSNEDFRDALIRALSRSEQIKGYEESLNLLVGTSREFQGDERDVMILITTASHRMTEAGKMRPPRAVLGEEMSRIYNVAASRAREKSILLHSIHPDAVAMMNPSCLRYRLVEHYRFGAQNEATSSPQALTELKQRYGQLGEELGEAFRAAGLEENLYPAFKIGNYRLDLAIIHQGRKLALSIDVDGDTDKTQKKLQEQMVLERAGWRCHRLSALQWWGHRSLAENKLQVWLRG
ncbi:MAG: hypothetical protein AAF927_03150, partial [Bacteroidota bacterium]